MTFPERFANLPDYAFPRLRKLLDAHLPGGPVLHMSIGEPRHPFPHWVSDIIVRHADEFGRYPPNPGTPELLGAISDWLNRRFGVSVDPDTRIMALNGSREGLFNSVLALCPETAAGKAPAVLMPNPFYQVYAVGAAAVGANAVYVPTSAGQDHLPDFGSLDPAILDRAAIAFVCSPSNPQGAVADRDYLRQLIDLAERHDFRVFADECYSEIYEGPPPPSALAVAAEMGADPERVVVFNSLSKRSNLPGLRSGFVAAGPRTMAALRNLRDYAGAPLPMPLQRVAERVWADESHVEVSRALYVEKYGLARKILGDVPGITLPRAGFFLWLGVPDGEEAAVSLWKSTGVRVLPGAYLGRSVGGKNPGQGYIRVALVAPKEEAQRGLSCIRDCLYD